LPSMAISSVNTDLGPGAVNFDYWRWFPHIFWFSGWTSNSSWPNGFCYKVLSARDEFAGRVEVVVLLEESNGSKHETYRFSIPTNQTRGTVEFLIADLSKRHGLSFEEQDYSGVRAHPVLLDEIRKRKRSIAH
jgi:hypothetical protein